MLKHSLFILLVFVLTACGGESDDNGGQSTVIQGDLNSGNTVNTTLIESDGTNSDGTSTSANNDIITVGIQQPDGSQSIISIVDYPIDQSSSDSSTSSDADPVLPISQPDFTDKTLLLLGESFFYDVEFQKSGVKSFRANELTLTFDNNVQDYFCQLKLEFNGELAAYGSATNNTLSFDIQYEVFTEAVNVLTIDGELCATSTYSDAVQGESRLETITLSNIETMDSEAVGDIVKTINEDFIFSSVISTLSLVTAEVGISYIGDYVAFNFMLDNSNNVHPTENTLLAFRVDEMRFNCYSYCQYLSFFVEARDEDNNRITRELIDFDINDDNVLTLNSDFDITEASWTNNNGIDFTVKSSVNIPESEALSVIDYLVSNDSDNNELQVRFYMLN